MAPGKARNGAGKRRHDEVGDSYDAPGKSNWFGSNFQVRKKFAFLPVSNDGMNSEEDEAMSYVRSVMTEADSLGVIYAKKVPVGNEQAEDSNVNLTEADDRGYFEDGAYIGAPWPEGSEAENTGDLLEGEQSIHPREAYTYGLLSSFQSMRQTLRSNPPAEVVAALSDDQPTICQGRKSKVRIPWGTRVRTTYPVPAQIAVMESRSLWRVLRICRDQFMPARNVSEELGCWIWAVLGKLPDIGEMHSDNVAELRMLAKRALKIKEQMLKPTTDASSWDGYAEEMDSDAESAAGSDAEFALERARARIMERLGQAEITTTAMSDNSGQRKVDDLVSGQSTPAQAISGAQEETTGQESSVLPSHSNAALEEDVTETDQQPAQLEGPKEPGIDEVIPNENTKAVVDMIITIVGELYGQKDLLEGRHDWD